MKYLILFLILFFSIGSYAQKDPFKNKPVELTKDWKEYKDSVNHFSLRYPSDWTIRIAAPTEKAKLFIRSPSEKTNDPFIENLNIIKKPVVIDKWPNDFQNSIKASLKTNMKNYRFMKDSTFSWKGADIYHIEYIHFAKLDEKETAIKVMQRILLKKKFLYTLTYTALENSSFDFYNKALLIMHSLIMD